MKSILLIEPDLVQLQSVKSVLVSSGYAVFTARSAEAAMAHAETTKFDLVILELQLQSHGGVEFLHEFRSYVEWQKIPVILYTLVPEHVLTPYKEQLDRLGVVGHAYKPTVSITKLIRAINSMENLSK